MTKQLYLISLLICLSFFSFSQTTNVKWAGVRSSSYGINPFPNSLGWATATKTMAEYFPGSEPTVVWLVGEIYFNGQNSGMDCYFPNPGGVYDPRIRFSSTDRYNAYFDYFDTNGINVFLQVEPGFANIDHLIDAILTRYGNHPCIVGVGIDIEWYKNSCDGCNNANVSDSVAQAWETRVKSFNSGYRLFLKHFDTRAFPPLYRGDIIFINDSQGYSSKNEFVSDMKSFANHFYPSDVMFQFGYDADKRWWNTLTKPIPQTIGKSLAQGLRQNCGIIWVDFTLRSVLPLTPTSSEEIRMEAPRVFPNQTKGIINLSPENVKKASVEIIDCVGRKVISQTWHSDNKTPLTIDLQKYGKGMYLVKIITDNNCHAEKVTVY